LSRMKRQLLLLVQPIVLMYLMKHYFVQGVLIVPLKLIVHTSMIVIKYCKFI